MSNEREVERCLLKLQPPPALLLMSGCSTVTRSASADSDDALFPPAAQLPADGKHQPAMADPQWTAGAAGAPWSTGATGRSRHVNVRDGLQLEAVPSPGGRWPP